MEQEDNDWKKPKASLFSFVIKLVQKGVKYFDMALNVQMSFLWPN